MATRCAQPLSASSVPRAGSAAAAAARDISSILPVAADAASAPLLPRSQHARLWLPGGNESFEALTAAITRRQAGRGAAGCARLLVLIDDMDKAGLGSTANKITLALARARWRWGGC